jgi:hypothetical protein
VKRRCSGRAATASTLLQFFGVIAPGFYWLRKRLASFSVFLSQRLVTALLTISRKLSACVCVLAPFFEITFG